MALRKLLYCIWVLLTVIVCKNRIFLRCDILNVYFLWISVALRKLLYCIWVLLTVTIYKNRIFLRCDILNVYFLWIAVALRTMLDYMWILLTVTIYKKEQSFCVMIFLKLTYLSSSGFDEGKPLLIFNS